MLTDKELITKISLLKKVKPASIWRQRNRALLLNQIYNGQPPEKVKTFGWFNVGVIWPFKVIIDSYRPALVSVFIFIIIFGSGLLGLEAAKNTKPGDFLYLAKIANEKTQFALTFNEKEKAKLGLEFATNRAKELSEVLAEPANQENKGKTVEKLVINFKEELNAVKLRLEKINIAGPKPKAVAQTTIPTKEQTAKSNSGEENEEFFSANSSKDKAGLQYAEGSAANTPVNSKAGSEEASETKTATSSLEQNKIVASSTGESKVETKTNPEEILEQAKDLLTKDDYSATLDKIDEASQAVSQVSSGEVKGVNESATTSAANAVDSSGATSSSEKK